MMPPKIRAEGRNIFLGVFSRLTRTYDQGTCERSCVLPRIIAAAYFVNFFGAMQIQNGTML